MAAKQASIQFVDFIGRPLESLTLAERWELVGAWVALELYSPLTLPLRTMEAVGASIEECRTQLASRGLNPSQYEYQLLPQPYESGS